MAFIMVVDDEATWRELISEALSEAGHRVKTFASGLDAIEDMKSQLPHLVILDVMMSPTGHEVLAFIHEKWLNVPVVMVSSFAGYRDDPQLRQAYAFWEKSMDLDRLVEVVRRALGPGGGDK